jgi:proteasome accessory factor B
MDRTERLLDLVALLLAEKRPVPWARLRVLFKQDYGEGALESCERKFERDKAELLELGIPLTFVPPTDEDEGGYLVDKDAYYLPEPGLSAEELAVLYAAGSAALSSGAFPGSQDLSHALRKVAFFGGRPVAPPRVRLELGVSFDVAVLPERLDALWAAISARKSVTLEYFSPRSGEVTNRRVDPYGLALRRGVWALAGHCHLRGGLRTFFVHRMRRLEVNATKPKSWDFEVPPTFRLDDAIPVWPWHYRVHPPVDVEVALSADLTPIARTVFGVEARSTTEGARVVVRATDLDALLTTVLSFSPGAKVVGPADAVGRARALAQRVLEAHPEAAAP